MKIFLAAIAVLAMLGALIELQQRRRVWRAFETEHVRRGGTLEPGSLLRYPKLILSEGGVLITISVFPGSSGSRGGSRPAATADFPAPVPPDKLVRIRSKSTQAVGERWLGMARALPVSDRAFAERFQVDGNDPVLAGGLLDADLSHRLLELDRETRAGIELRVEKGAATVFMERPRRFWDFAALIDLARGFRDRLERNAV